MARVVRTKAQIEAIAWSLYAGGGTFDEGDVECALRDFYINQGWQISQNIQKAIIDRVGDIHMEHLAKANHMFVKAFPNER
jgi:hypothetical protein